MTKRSVLNYIPIPVCAALSVFFSYFPITDTDIFWHLAAGREMVSKKHFLFTDPFSFTLASPPWTDLHWLFQLIVYGLYLWGGLWAIIFFKLAVVAFVVAVLCLILRPARYVWISSFLCAVLFYLGRYLVLDRPVLITMMCMALFMLLFERVRLGANRRLLWLCIPLEIIWTNSQGLYPIGIFLIGAYWVECLLAAKSLRLFSVNTLQSRNDSTPAFFTLIFFLCCLSCLVTPYGISGITLPFKLFGRIAPDTHNIYSLNISENVPLLSLTGFETGYRYSVFVTAFLTTLLLVLNGKRMRISHVLLFGGFLALAFSAVRMFYCISSSLSRSSGLRS